MTPQEISAAITVLETAIGVTPELIQSFEKLFDGDNPTAAEFQALRAKVEAEDFSVDAPNG